MTDTDKLLEWKQTLLFLGGIFTNITGLFLVMLIKILGIVVSLAGLGMLILNMRAIKRGQQNKKIKKALLIPKGILFGFLLLVSLLVYINAFA